MCLIILCSSFTVCIKVEDEETGTDIEIVQNDTAQKTETEEDIYTEEVFSEYERQETSDNKAAEKEELPAES